MSTTSNHELTLLRESVERLATTGFEPLIEALNHYPDGAGAADLATALADGLRDLGLLNVSLPEELGGLGDPAAVCVVLETLARRFAAPAALLFAHCLAQEVFVVAGQRNGQLDELVSSLSLESSADDGSQLLAYPAYAEPTDKEPQVVATAVGDALELHGTCEFVVNAPIAEMLVAPVLCAGAPSGVAVIAAPTLSPGITVGEPLLTLGMRGCPVADVTFDGARVPTSSVVAPAGVGHDVIREAAKRLRGAAVAVSRGILACSIRGATEYAQERYQGGGKIIEHQEVRRLLADMLASHATCSQAISELSTSPGPAETAATNLFLRAKEEAAHATSNGVQLLGGYGYMEDYGQERCMRDAKQAQCLLGRCAPQQLASMDEWIASGAPL